jgi:hypothetical protein
LSGDIKRRFGKREYILFYSMHVILDHLRNKRVCLYFRSFDSCVATKRSFQSLSFSLLCRVLFAAYTFAERKEQHCVCHRVIQVFWNVAFL